MAKITLTELLGTDNVALSRTTINQNFSTTENAINKLGLLLDTSADGGALSVGDLKIVLVGNNTTATTTFTNAGSEIINGNSTIKLNLRVEKILEVTGDVTFHNRLILDGAGANPALSIGTLSEPVPVYHNMGMKVDGEFKNSEPVDINAATYNLDIANKYVVYLDCINAPGGASVITLTGEAIEGQRLFIQITAAPVTGGTFELDKTAFQTQYSANIILAGATDAVLKKLWVEVVYTSGGWKVIGSHPDVENI